MTREEFAERFPEAAAFAQAMRQEFGEGVRIVYARNRQGDVIKTKKAAEPPEKV